MICYILILHFISDFILQSRAIAESKSENFKSLLIHISTIWIVFLIGLFYFYGMKNAFYFSTLNAIIHAIIDRHIWLFYKWKIKNWMKKNPMNPFTLQYAGTGIFPYWRDSLFYNIIGLDQLFHTLTLVILSRYF